MRTNLLSICGAGVVLLALASPGAAQPPDFQFPGGPGGFGGRGGRGGPMQQDVELVKTYDKDGDGRLNAEERKAARAAAAERSGGRGFGRMGGRSRIDGNVAPGRKLTPADVKHYGSEPLYEGAVLRTLFLEFENPDWEKELSDFYGTDVDVPAKLTVDNKIYTDVGVHFRGASSYMGVPEGRKRSLNLSVDFAQKDQRLLGYRTLNLLNANQDPSFLRTVLFHHIARQYVPAPKANLVRVAINGESWGIYVNAQQFNGDFIKEWFNTTKGARWKVPGNPGARSSGLSYQGDDPAVYKRLYEIKNGDEPKAWEDLIRLCKTLSQTPAAELERALEPLLDIDGALKFLAVDIALINNDGYWVRGSDYSLYQDVKGRFHVFPHDANETFAQGEGRGGSGGVQLDPLAASADSSKALYKLLAVPALRDRYLKYVRDVAENWLGWEKIGPLAEQYHALVAEEVKADNRKLTTTEAFEKSLTADTVEEPGGLMGPPPDGFGPGRGGRGMRGFGGGPGRGGAGISLKSFVEQRRAYLLNYPEIVKLAQQ